MAILWTILPITVFLISGANAIIPRHLFPPPQPQNLTGETGEPLFLTPYIQKGDFEGGRNASLIQNLTASEQNGSKVPIPQSFSGYLTVNEQYNSNLFFWFFTALEPNGTWEDAPLILWLQGGPGGSSLFGLFTEHGPILVSKDLILKTRNLTWAGQFNLLYIDNPVGTGFSFTDQDAGYAKTEVDVGRDLYSALIQFLKLFPMLQDNPFYVTGESYAGKYVPAISYTIYKNNKQTNPAPEFKINLQGLAIGDGLIDPENMLQYGNLLYSIGLIDDRQRDEFHEQEELGRKFISEGKFREAFEVFDTILNGDMTNSSSLFTNTTGFNFYYNYLKDVAPADEEVYSRFIEWTEVREAIHVGNKTFNDGKAVEEHLLEDVMRSTKPWLQTLLNNDFKVLIYSGQLDIIVGYQLTRSFINTMDWKYSQDFKNATRTIWKVEESDAEVAGYVRNAHNLWEVLVRNAGHMVPTDQPRAALDLIQKFIWGEL